MNIAVVGGGPVGLTTVINLIYSHQIKNKIDIYEKRNKYTREQFLVFGGTKGGFII